MIQLRIAFRGFVFLDLTMFAELADATPNGADPDLLDIGPAETEAVDTHDATELRARRAPVGFRIP